MGPLWMPQRLLFWDGWKRWFWSKSPSPPPQLPPPLFPCSALKQQTPTQLGRVDGWWWGLGGRLLRRACWRRERGVWGGLLRSSSRLCCIGQRQRKHGFPPYTSTSSTLSVFSQSRRHSHLNANLFRVWSFCSFWNIMANQDRAEWALQWMICIRANQPHLLFFFVPFWTLWAGLYKECNETRTSRPCLFPPSVYVFPLVDHLSRAQNYCNPRTKQLISFVRWLLFFFGNNDDDQWTVNRATTLGHVNLLQREWREKKKAKVYGSCFGHSPTNPGLCWEENLPADLWRRCQWGGFAEIECISRGHWEVFKGVCVYLWDTCVA